MPRLAYYYHWVADGKSIGLGAPCVQERVEVNGPPHEKTSRSCTSEEVELQMDLGIEGEFEINVGRQYFFSESFI